MSSVLGRISLCVLAISLCTGFCVAADIDSAKRAYDAKDYATALKELTPLAEQGDADARSLLGKMYWKGQGVLKDADQAVKLFKASAALGNADAQFFLGSYYLLPHTDVAEGAKWLRLSADQGNQDAQWLLGKAYLEGDKDLPRDPVQAGFWLQLAADHNLDFYVAAYRAADARMTPDQRAKARALAAAWKPKPASSTGEKSPSK